MYGRVGDFICISPQCELDDQAKEGAAGAQDQLRRVKVYPSFSDFLSQEPEGIRIALSARDLRSRSSENLDVRLQEIASKHALTFDRIYLIFGPEDDGLSHSDLELVHHICKLPTFGEFTSLNLSHAVLLATYLFSSQFSLREDAPKMRKTGSEAFAHHHHHRRPQLFPQQSIHEWLKLLGFNLDQKYVNAEKTLNRIILENEPTYEELKVLESILQQNIRKLRGQVHE